MPASVYSRVVSVSLLLPADGNQYYNYTNQLGQDIRLLKVQVWHLPKAINIANVSAFSITAGSGPQPTGPDIANWENVLPLIDPNRQGAPWVLYDGQDYKEWELCKIFSGEARRFAVAGYRGVGMGTDALWVSFTVSEG